MVARAAPARPLVGLGLEHPADRVLGLLEDGYQIRTADMPGADDLMMRIYAAMAQKERELISERTSAPSSAMALGPGLTEHTTHPAPSQPPGAPCVFT
jgi:hypothetical protein